MFKRQFDILQSSSQTFLVNPVVRSGQIEELEWRIGQQNVQVQIKLVGQSDVGKLKSVDEVRLKEEKVVKNINSNPPTILN